MDSIDRICELTTQAHIPKQLELIQTEKATRSALITPFTSARDCDVFNPAEVTTVRIPSGFK